jgi:hypothetical protein
MCTTKERRLKLSLVPFKLKTDLEDRSLPSISFRVPSYDDKGNFVHFLAFFPRSLISNQIFGGLGVAVRSFESRLVVL